MSARVKASRHGIFKCQCGNVPWNAGFDSCQADGTECEPLADGSWDGHWVCLGCGIIFHEDEVEQTDVESWEVTSGPSAGVRDR